MKKIICIIVVAMMMFFTGCGSDKESNLKAEELKILNTKYSELSEDQKNEIPSISGHMNMHDWNKYGDKLKQIYIDENVYNLAKVGSKNSDADRKIGESIYEKTKAKAIRKLEGKETEQDKQENAAAEQAWNDAGEKVKEDDIKDALGSPKDINKDSGVTQVQKSSDGYNVTYNLYPLKGSNYNAELGIKLTQKIKKMYSDKIDVDKIQFTCNGPVEDKYGNITWKPIISFQVNRDIFEKINWDNFQDSNLINVVNDVKQLK